MSSYWRVFPWRSGAAPGERFSPSHIPEPTGRGRFDLPRELSPVLYLAETPDHAVGEALQAWRARPLEPAHLLRAGLPLALVVVVVPAASSARLADLCEAAYLNARAVAPDTTASRLRERTQQVARAAWDRGHHGLRWWSTFWGDWHTVVLFTARVDRVVRYGDPVALSVDHPAVLDAAGLLGMATG
ncbi:MAG: hypothetical protein AMXMBFR53_21910 [Gemmatimonadota bacterium]